MPQRVDRRVQRTRDDIFRAFRALVMERGYDEITASDIAERANVGRSTFYSHFRNKDDVLVSSVDPLLGIVADALSGDGVEAQLHRVIAHFWDMRAVGRVILAPPTGDVLTAVLADRIRSTDSASAAFRAGGFMFVVRAWISGRIDMTTDEIRRWLMSVGRCD